MLGLVLGLMEKLVVIGSSCKDWLMWLPGDMWWFRLELPSKCLRCANFRPSGAVLSRAVPSQ
jgi:hypothetical protein